MEKLEHDTMEKLNNFLHYRVRKKWTKKINVFTSFYENSISPFGSN